LKIQFPRLKRNTPDLTSDQREEKKHHSKKGERPWEIRAARKIRKKARNKAATNTGRKRVASLKNSRKTRLCWNFLPRNRKKAADEISPFPVHLEVNPDCDGTEH
jgi:hypothetical protein